MGRYAARAAVALLAAFLLGLVPAGDRAASASHVRADRPAWTTASLNLRSGPSTGYRILRVLPPVTRVEVAGAVPGTHWYRVSALTGGTRTAGYVSGAYIAGSDRYVFPVQPASAASYGRCHHDYPASDVFAPTGQRYVAVTSGTVEFVRRTDPWVPAVDDPATRGGIVVTILGRDGVRYYGAHLSAVASGITPGLRMRAGQLLGLTGRSRNARYTPAHTHVGISRPTTAGDWRVRRGHVAPARYLDAWRARRLATPDLTAAPSGVC